MFMCVHVFVEACVFLDVYIPYFCRQYLSANKEPTYYVDGLASKSQESTCFCFPTAGITGAHCHTWLLYVVKSALGLHAYIASTVPAEPSPHTLYFILLACTHCTQSWIS